MESYIKLYRKIRDNPIVMRDSDYLATWVLLLLEAKAFEKESYLGGKKIMLKPGQLITTRKELAKRLSCNESKIQRILSCYESEQLIEQQTSRQNRLISILSWDKYQGFERPKKQRTNNKRTTDEQQMNTSKERKEREKDNIYINNIYGEYQNVKLSAEDMERLMKEFPADYKERIERLSEYMASKGVKYKNHLATIRSWARKEAKSEKDGTHSGNREKETSTSQVGEEAYDYDKFFV